MDTVKHREWSVSEARSQLSELIERAFDEPQIIVDKKTKDMKAVAVIPLALFELIKEIQRKERISRLDNLFLEMQQSAGDESILLPRPDPKPVINFSGED